MTWTLNFRTALPERPALRDFILSLSKDERRRHPRIARSISGYVDASMRASIKLGPD